MKSTSIRRVVWMGTHHSHPLSTLYLEFTFGKSFPIFICKMGRKYSICLPVKSVTIIKYSKSSASSLLGREVCDLGPRGEMKTPAGVRGLSSGHLFLSREGARLTLAVWPPGHVKTSGKEIRRGRRHRAHMCRPGSCPPARLSCLEKTQRWQLPMQDTEVAEEKVPWLCWPGGEEQRIKNKMN